MSWDEEIFFAGVDDVAIRREKAKARELRKSRWWLNKIGEGRCYYCGRRFPPAQLTMDHVVPLTKGGCSAKNNLVPSCKECNTRKKTMLPQEWQDYMDSCRGTHDPEKGE
jgi:5-methylcytosine-specific restriction endonuclease McrA